ncbi:molybdopterin converting factor subunit 1 [Teredinibacter purpureus]|uniref:molybdopterin converting factor subunit 1 n=1 Tax=Teredinibacter purpureus TaxID=2731756 RepID=UPI0005F84B3C|nr:molybdopterin converting factor subunit 1 [Teredinibacter purpureus]
MSNSNNTITLLYFASLGENLGTTQETLPLNGIANIAELIATLSQRDSIWAEQLRSTKIKCAVNQTIRHYEHPLQHGDEVAFFPPVTGG